MSFSKFINLRFLQYYYFVFHQNPELIEIIKHKNTKSIFYNIKLLIYFKSLELFYFFHKIQNMINIFLLKLIKDES